MFIINNDTSDITQPIGEIDVILKNGKVETTERFEGMNVETLKQVHKQLIKIIEQMELAIKERSE